MSEVTASLVVTFRADAAAAEDDGQIQLEIDSRETGLNEGKTSFEPGDSVYFLMFKTSNVTITAKRTTAGAIGNAGAGTLEVEEFLTFDEETEKTLKYPVASDFSLAWQGRNGGAARLKTERRVVLPTPGFGVAKVTYKAAFSAYRLANVSQNIEQVLIRFEGETVDG